MVLSNFGWSLDFLSRAPTAAAFGTTAGMAFLWMTEWQVVLRYVPGYGSKFDEPPVL